MRDMASRSKIPVMTVILLLLFVNFADIRGVSLSRCNRLLNEEDNSTEGVSPFDVNECLDALHGNGTNCTFHCEIPCSFGYEVDSDGCPYQNCSCASTGMFEGDIKFDIQDFPFMSRVYDQPRTTDEVAHGVAINRPTWDEDRIHGRVKIGYEVDHRLSQPARSAISEAIDRFSRSTCIDFRPRTNQSNFLVFTKSSGCWSFVGMRGGPQLISIGSGCARTGVVQHELLHALGFWHEQSRPDRDVYVEIVLENVWKDYAHNFRKRVAIDSLGSEYDKNSIMHYSGYAFSSNSLPTILDKATMQPIIAQRDDLTNSDTYQVNKMYGCEEQLAKMSLWAQWQAWSACSESCGVGTRVRVRKCEKKNLPVSTSNCHGKNVQVENCTATECRGSWQSWQSWTACSATCGSGYHLRQRICTGGIGCEGKNWEVKFCNTKVCSKVSFSKVVALPVKCVGGKMALSDLSNDGKDDVLCFRENGVIGIYRSTPQFAHKLWEGTIAKCDGQRHVGDFNGDGFEDILCVDKAGRSLHVTAGEGVSFAPSPIWSSNMGGFCEDGVIDTGYIDGDKKKDIVCLSEDGSISVLVHSH